MIALLRVLRDNPLDVSFGGGGHTLISRKQQPTASGRHRERRSPQSKQVPSFANHRDRLLTTLECASQVTRRRRLTRRRRGVGRVLNSYKREMDGLPPEPLPIVSHFVRRISSKRSRSTRDFACACRVMFRCWP